MWGFEPETHPAIMASSDGFRDSLRKASRFGDFVMFVGTKGPPTADEERGRLLGLANFEDTPVDTLDICPKDTFRPHHFEGGSFKWPKALPILRAWRFDAPLPVLTDILERQLPRSATLGFVKLSERDRQAIMALPRHEVTVPQVEIVSRNAFLGSALANNRIGATNGPMPTTHTGTITQNTDQTAFTYAMRFGDSDIWKFGWCFNPEKRRRNLNAHIPTELFSAEWKVVYTQAWPNAESAYAMEQAVLKRFANERTMGERARISAEKVMPQWIEAIKDCHRK